MRTSMLAVATVIAMSVFAVAQEQQAGNEASTNADETFQKLIDKCDDTDMLMLRARIRLQLASTTEAAGKEASSMLGRGFAQCGEGKLDEAKSTLQTALDIAAAGVTDKLAETTAAAQKAREESEAQAEKSAEKKPWWQIW